MQAGFHPAPSCPLLSVRLADPRLIFVPPVHFSTSPFPQQLPFCVPTPPTDVGSRSRDRDGRGRCVVKCVGGRGQHQTRTQEHAQPHYPDPDHHYASPRADAASSRRLAPACRDGAQASGRGEQGARHDNQNGSPSHAMTITLPPGIPPLPAHTPPDRTRLGGGQVQARIVWGDRLDASRCGRHHGRSTVSSPTPVGESVSASGVQDLGEASRRRKTQVGQVKIGPVSSVGRASPW